MKYSEVKVILERLRKDRWRKLPGWDVYSKIWTKGDSHFKYDMFFWELQNHMKSMSLEEVLLRLDTEARHKLDEHHRIRERSLR